MDSALRAFPDSYSSMLAPGHATRAVDGMTAPIHIKSIKEVLLQGIPLLGKYWPFFGPMFLRDEWEFNRKWHWQVDRPIGIGLDNIPLLRDPARPLRTFLHHLQKQNPHNSPAP